MDYNELLALFIRRRWVVIAVFATTFLGHVTVLVLQPDAFASESLVKVRERDASKWVDQNLGSLDLFEPFNAKILNRLIRDDSFQDLVHQELEDSNQAHLSQSWKSDSFQLSVDQEDLYKASYKSTDRYEIMPLLDASVLAAQSVASQYIEKTIRTGMGRLNGRLQAAESRIEDARGQLEKLRSQANIPPGTQGVKQLRDSLLRRVEEYERSELKLSGEVAEARRMLQLVQSEFSLEKQQSLPYLLQAAQGSTISVFLAKKRTGLLEQQSKIHILSTEYGKAHPEILKQERILKKLTLEYDAYFNPESPVYKELLGELEIKLENESFEQKKLLADLLGKEGFLLSTQRVLNEKRKMLSVLSQNEADMLKLEKDIAGGQRLKDNLLLQVENIETRRNLAPEIVTVFRSASAPKRVGSQLDRYVPLVFILALAFSIAAVYLLEAFDHRIHNQHILRKHFNMPLLGFIPELQLNNGDVPAPGATARGQEAFNAILKKTLVSLGDGKTILVTGPDPSAGKTFFSSNLAISAGKLGIKTLLVDADIRAPKVASHFGTPQSPGLRDVLEGSNDIRFDALEAALLNNQQGSQGLWLRPNELPLHCDSNSYELLLKDGNSRSLYQLSGHPNLDIVTSGHPMENPSSNLMAERMTEFLAKAEGNYSLIIIDSPPLSLVADALLLGPKVSGTILVVRAGQTKSQDLYWAKQSLDDVQAPVIGCVLNALGHRAAGYYSYYYGRKYYRARV